MYKFIADYLRHATSRSGLILKGGIVRMGRVETRSKSVQHQRGKLTFSLGAGHLVQLTSLFRAAQMLAL